MNQAKPSDRRLVALVKVQKEESAPPQDAIEQRWPELNRGGVVSGMWLARRHTWASPLLTTSPSWLNPGPWLQRPLTCCRPFHRFSRSQDLTQTSTTDKRVAQEAQSRESLSKMQWAREKWTVHPAHSRRTIGSVSMSLACLVHQGLTANTMQDLVSNLLSREPLNLAEHPRVRHVAFEAH